MERSSFSSPPQGASPVLHCPQGCPPQSVSFAPLYQIQRPLWRRQELAPALSYDHILLQPDATGTGSRVKTIPSSTTPAERAP